MQELTDDLRKLAGEHASPSDPFETDDAVLARKAAKAWAAHSLDAYCKPLLAPALNISKALAEFASALGDVRVETS